jgi:hypothetical protein
MKRMAVMMVLLFSVFLSTALAVPREAVAYALSVKATHIVNGAARPYPGVTVTIKKAGSSAVLKTLPTGATGIAKFTLKGGRYIVSCATDRYEFTPLKKTVLLDSNKLLIFKAVDEGAVENIRRKLVAVIARHPELKEEIPLPPADYQKVANELAKVPGVQGADYSGDTLGTFYIKVSGGGVIGYRHIRGDMNEMNTLPPGVTHTDLRDPTYNADWQESVRANASNTWADHFPVAAGNPDPDYTQDDTLACRQEGRIAIIDFYYTDVHENFNLYETDFLVDGVEIWERIRRVAKAAGFGVDFYKDADINLGNYTMLQDYTMVITNGHGGRPGMKTFKRTGFAVTRMETAEKYNPAKITANGLTYFDSWKRGQIHFDARSKQISWTPVLFRDGYRPSVTQQWLMSQCWALLPFWVGYYEDSSGWHYSVNLLGDVYNFGDGLLDAGVTSVFGYIDPAWPKAIVANLMRYLRRTFGGYSKKDVPPARFGLNYWPTCMAAETFFRLPSLPESADFHAPKLINNCTFTMYAKPEPKYLYLRKACSEFRYPHSAMQDFVLSVGTPATAFTTCWDEFWSAGNWTGIDVGPLCGQGNPNYPSEQAAMDAGCQVKQARKATNAFLTAP